MISGVNLVEVQEVTLDNDKKDPTIWKIGVLPAYVLAKITALVAEDNATAMFNIVQLGLKGWDNFKVGEKSIDFRTEKATKFGKEMDIVPMDLIDHIPFYVIVELSTKIMGINQLTESEQKN